MEALHAIWEPLLKKVTEAVETADRPLWVTGHSLGGALALLAAWRLQRSFVTVHEVVTFGAPMIGNDAAARAFEQEFAGKIFRYVNLEDPVPLLPSVSLVANSYAHCQSEVSMKAVQAAVSALEELKETAGSAVDRVIEATQIDLLWKAVQGRISAHFIDHYQERVKEKCGPEVPPTVAAEGADEPAESPRAGDLTQTRPSGSESMFHSPRPASAPGPAAPCPPRDAAGRRPWAASRWSAASSFPSIADPLAPCFLRGHVRGLLVIRAGIAVGVGMRKPRLQTFSRGVGEGGRQAG